MSKNKHYQRDLDQAMIDEVTVGGNARVIAVPHSPTFNRAKAGADECNLLIAEIKRHCDEVASLDYEIDTLCRYCGSEWEVQKYADNDIPKGQPLCCDEAIADFDRIRVEIPQEDEDAD